MASTLRIGSAALLLAFVPSTPASLAQSPSQRSHVIVARDDIQWKPLRPGAEIAVISGDPAKEGSPFVIRMRYHGKARIPPHWHPVDEHLTVLNGTFRIGMGERGDETATTALVAGSYALLPAKMPHYAWTGGDALIQVHGVGPFAINYVNAADDPAKNSRD
jgi:quercetin dioxygenase-like cupin family protein